MPEKPEECDSCGWPTEDLEEYRRRGPPYDPKTVGTKWLCHLCAYTQVGTWMDYPDQHNGEIVQLFEGMCYIGNAILEAIRKAS